MRFLVAGLALALVSARPALQPLELAVGIVGFDGVLHLGRDETIHVRVTNLGHQAALVSTYGGYTISFAFDSGAVVTNDAGEFVCGSCSVANDEKHRLAPGESLDVPMTLSRRKGKPLRGPGVLRIEKPITALDASGGCTSQTLVLRAMQRAVAK